jgi:hypothetical protein
VQALSTTCNASGAGIVRQEKGFYCTHQTLSNKVFFDQLERRIVFARSVEISGRASNLIILIKMYPFYPMLHGSVFRAFFIKVQTSAI